MSYHVFLQLPLKRLKVFDEASEFKLVLEALGESLMGGEPAE